MPTGLRVLQLTLGLGACLLALDAVRELGAARPLPSPPAPLPARAAPAGAPAADPPGPGGYDLIVAKSLFSPSRTEVPAAGAVAAGPKPTLHGVVMDGASRRAYLEDPAQKQTFGYVVGDPVVGGRVASIAADRVVIARGEGAVEILLRDPAKPRPPAPPAATSGPPGATPAIQPGPPTPEASGTGPTPAAISEPPSRHAAEAAEAPAARMDR